jgi:succinyl-diaminopimelate desuccinylase
MSIAKIFSEADKASKEVAELTSGLVKFNSAHPEGRTDEIVPYIAEYLDKYGIAHEVHAQDPKKPNIVAKLKGKSEHKVLWVGHIDVVPEGKPEAWKYPAYDGVIKGGIVHGRGSSDMKGSCAAAMVSARILSKMRLPHPVEFWFTSDEEIGGGAGAKWLAESGRFKGDVCIIGDGNGGGAASPSIDLGCKGGAQTRLISKGKTAHGSTPFLGDNAINKLIKVIPEVYKIGNYKLELPEDLNKPIRDSVKFYMAEAKTPELQKAIRRMFNYPSVTCNIINGGVKINVVPDYAEAEFDIRLTPGASVSAVRAEIERLVKAANVPGVEVASGRETHASGRGKLGDKAGFYESPDTVFAKQLVKTIKKATGKRPSLKLLTGGTDGISTSKISGIPSLGYGTSISGVAHQPNEYITVENLVLGIKVYAAFPYFYKP